MSAHVAASLSAYLDGELESADRQTVEAHLHAVRRVREAPPRPRRRGRAGARPAPRSARRLLRGVAGPGALQGDAAAAARGEGPGVVLGRGRGLARGGRHACAARADPEAGRGRPRRGARASVRPCPRAGGPEGAIGRPAAVTIGGRPGRSRRKGRTTNGRAPVGSGEGGRGAADRPSPAVAPSQSKWRRGSSWRGGTRRLRSPSPTRPTAKDKARRGVDPAAAAEPRAHPRRARSFAPPPEASSLEGAAGQHLYEPEAERDVADAPAAAAAESKKAASPRSATRGLRDAEGGRSEPAGPEAQVPRPPGRGAGATPKTRAASGSSGARSSAQGPSGAGRPTRPACGSSSWASRPGGSRTTPPT